MITVRRANVLLDVPEEQKYEYLAKGFDVVASDGTVIEHTVPSDVNVLKKAYTDHISEIAKLKAKLAEKSNESDSVSQEDYNALLSDYNEAMDTIDSLNATIADLENDLDNLENVADEPDEKPVKKKTSKK